MPQEVVEERKRIIDEDRKKTELLVDAIKKIRGKKKEIIEASDANNKKNLKERFIEELATFREEHPFFNEEMRSKTFEKVEFVPKTTYDAAGNKTQNGKQKATVAKKRTTRGVGGGTQNIKQKNIFQAFRTVATSKATQGAEKYSTVIGEIFHEK